jgi:RNA polymerase sigma-70 factor (ECF subfamily)
MSEEVISVNSINVDESILLKRAIYQRDKKAVEVLHTKHYQSIFRYIAARVGFSADAEDIAQNVFVELCKGDGCYDGCGNVKEYLFGIARNNIRRYHRERTNSIRTVPVDSIEDVGPSYNIRQQDPVHQVAEQQLKKAIKDALAQLPLKAQEAIRLRFIEGLNSKEAAKKAGSSTVAFRQRLHMAVRALRKLKSQRAWAESNARNL